MRYSVSLLVFLAANLASAQSSQPSKTSPDILQENPSPPPSRPVLLPDPNSLRPEVHILAQGWFDSAAGEQGSFRIRRAEIGAIGNIIPKKFRYALFLDPSNALLTADQETPSSGGANVILRDFFLTLVLTRKAELSVGQFRSPVSLEGYSLSGRLLFPERSIVSQAFGDERDIGARIEGWGERFYYNLSFFNGAGQNQLDDDQAKDLAGRFEIYPAKGLLFGAAGLGRVLAEEGTEAKTRLGLDMKYERGLFVGQAEAHLATDGDIPRAGAYVAGLLPLPLLPQLQIGARFSLLARDLRAADQGGPPNPERSQELSFGLNYYLKGNQAKLQASASFFKDLSSAEDGTALAEESSQFILAAQAAF